MAINLAQAKVKLNVGNQKVKKAFLGEAQVYSSGNIVTYQVDSNLSYKEEVEYGVSCLAPKSFTPAKSGWTFVGWRSDTAANSSVLTSRIMGDDPITLYAVFQQAITVTYYNGSVSASSSAGKRLYNNGKIANPSFTLSQAALSGWTARGWSTSNAANGGITYNNGAAFTRDSNVTLYGMYQAAVTVTYYNGSTTASKSTGTRYYCPGSGKIANPSFTLNQAALSGWTARGWSASGTANSGITYNNGAAFTRDSNVTLFGMYQQTITLTLYNGSNSAANQSRTRYHCPGSGSTVNPAFTVTPAALSGWSFNGWAASSGATAAIAYSSISNTAFSANTTLYGRYSQTITLSYNGNGASGGSTAAQTGTRYWNTGNVANPSFTLRANGFTRTGYTWSKWAFGSAGGTQYANGATVTLGANAVFYALWVAAPHTIAPNSVTWTKTREAYATDVNITITASEARLRLRKNPDAYASGRVAVQANISTGGCANVRFVTAAPHNGNLWASPIIYVDGVEKEGTGNLEFSVSGKSSIEVVFEAVTAHSYAPVEAVLSQIYFYN